MGVCPPLGGRPSEAEVSSESPWAYQGDQTARMCFPVTRLGNLPPFCAVKSPSNTPGLLGRGVDGQASTQAVRCDPSVTKSTPCIAVLSWPPAAFELLPRQYTRSHRPDIERNCIKKAAYTCPRRAEA